MEIYIQSSNCEIQNNYWFLPTLSEINLIIKNLEKMRDIIRVTDIEKYNNEIRKELFKPTKLICNKNTQYKKWYIYIIKQWKYYKIWKTIDIQSRIKKYITENPNEIELIHSYKVKDYTSEEKILHNKYKNKNYRWEWFELSKEDILYIKNQKDEV